MTLPPDDLSQSDTIDDQSAQDQITRLVSERASYGDQKNAIHRAIYRRRLRDEMQRVWGTDDLPQAPTSRPLYYYLALTGMAGFLVLLLAVLI